LDFNQSEERKSISDLINFVLIGQNSIQFQSQSLVWYGLCAIASFYFYCLLDVKQRYSAERRKTKNSADNALPECSLRAEDFCITHNI